MAYPPSSPADNKADATPTATDHPAHHNALADAIIDIITELGSAPHGASADLTARLTALDSSLAGKQPLDSDLTAIAALSTTSFGRALLALADAAAGRTAFGLGTAATSATGDFDAAGAAAAAQAASQPLDSDLTAIAALTTTSFGRAFLALADAAAARVAIGVDFASPTVALGSAASTGTAASVIHSDATIVAFDATAPSTQAFSDSAVVGTAAFAARRDHKHAMPANPAPSFATPAVVLGTAAAAGAASTVIRSDSTIVAFDATVPVTQAYSDAAAVGVATVAARRDHKHGMPASPPGGFAVYGDGSDGAPTFDGSTTILGMVPSSSVYTLVRDVFLADGATINNGVSIIGSGFRLFCSGTLTNNGTIKDDGNSSASSTAGANLSTAAATITATTRGRVGGSGATGAGNNGNSVTTAYGGGGGGGGAGGTGALSTGGTVTGPTAVQGSIRALPWAALGMLISGGQITTPIVGGAGGGGGGGDGSNPGGGGGGGGGIVLLAVKVFAGTGAIRARGGAGFSPTAGNTGGGGGGGGGIVIVISSSVSAGAISGQTIDTNGGALGTHHGNSPAADGQGGSSGTIVLIPN